MDFSFFRTVTTALRLSTISLKKQAKRLQKAAPDIFGQEFPLHKCQEAIARSHNLRRWSDIEALEKTLGRNRSLPFWHITSRNQTHEGLLLALMYSEIEARDSGALIFLGKVGDCIRPALCLWLEEISDRKEPGLILVDTNASSVQDTAIGAAIREMQLDELFLQFRVVDTRQICIPISIGATPRDWARSLMHAVPAAVSDGFRAQDLLEIAITNYVDKRGGKIVSDDCLDELSYAISKSSKARDDDVRPETAEALLSIISSLRRQRFGLGTVLWSESKHRPSVVLFDSARPETLVLASMAHAMYYWQYVGVGLRDQGIKIRPVLYFSDQSTSTIPTFIAESGGSHTAIVNGCDRTDVDSWPNHLRTRHSLVSVNDRSIVYCGKRVGFDGTRAVQVAG